MHRAGLVEFVDGGERVTFSDLGWAAAIIEGIDPDDDDSFGTYVKRVYDREQEQLRVRRRMARR